MFFGLSLATPKAALIRAILEGTAFALRHNVDVGRAAGVQISEIRSVGGGARSKLWNQIKADVLGLPVLLPETSVGARQSIPGGAIKLRAENVSKKSPSEISSEVRSDLMSLCVSMILRIHCFDSPRTRQPSQSPWAHFWAQ